MRVNFEKYVKINKTSNWHFTFEREVKTWSSDPGKYVSMDYQISLFHIFVISFVNHVETHKMSNTYTVYNSPKE